MQAMWIPKDIALLDVIVSVKDTIMSRCTITATEKDMTTTIQDDIKSINSLH